MKIKTPFSNETSLQRALDDIERQLRGFSPTVLVVAFNTQFDGDALVTELEARFGCSTIGGSSCKGALVINGDKTQSQAAISLFAIHDPEGHYGVGYSSLVEGQIQLCATSALDMALYASGRGFESPSLIWCILPPGHEEQILEGFQSVVGNNVPIIGGSSADNDVSGQWQQISTLTSANDQIVVLALYPSSGIGFSFSSGYKPTGKVVTATASQGRLLTQLDDEPAAACYNRLTNGSISDFIESGNVLSITTLHPLGRIIDSQAEIKEFVLSHPDSVADGQALTLFSEIKEGEQLHIMEGSKHSLIQRASRVINNAIDLIPNNRTAAGVLLIYCAGCMLTIEDELHKMLESLQQSLPNLPIMGIYTFGEQGCFLDGKSRHGNLMISAVAFSQ